MFKGETMKIIYILKCLKKYIKSTKKIFFVDLICAFLSTIFNIISPMIVRYISNGNSIYSLAMSSVVKLTTIYIFVCILSAFASFYMNYKGNIMSLTIETEMRSDLFKHLQKLSPSFYDDNKIGQIMSRMTHDLSNAASFVHTIATQVITSIITVVILCFILQSINIWLTLILIILMPMIFICTKYFNKHMHNIMQKQREQVGEINSKIEDSISGISVVQSFANEKAEEEKFEICNKKYADIRRKEYWYFSCLNGAMQLFSGVMYVGVIIMGALFLINNKIGVGDFAAYLLYSGTVWSSVKTIVYFTEHFQRDLTGIERFLEIMGIDPEIKNDIRARHISKFQGNIEFKNVNFGYKHTKTNVLNNISFKITKGENVALVGSSGIGKTTIVNLILRFYEVSSGEILLDGINIKNIDIACLRKSIGIVQQDIYLFSISVYENILYGNLSSSKEDVIKAAKRAGAHEFIVNLENGYDTRIGENGAKLSEGQKQRIGIARAFLKNPSILILDEATSALDNETEAVVQQSLEELSKGRTVITIAHRLTTIKKSDRIMVLTEKGISEIGTHEELMNKHGTYYNMYNIVNKDNNNRHTV